MVQGEGRAFGPWVLGAASPKSEGERVPLFGQWAREVEGRPERAEGESVATEEPTASAYEP